MIRITSPQVTHTDASIKARRSVVLVADLQQGSNEMIGSDEGKRTAEGAHDYGVVNDNPSSHRLAPQRQHCEVHLVRHAVSK
jgi:hypothetical protein